MSDLPLINVLYQLKVSINNNNKTSEIGIVGGKKAFFSQFKSTISCIFFMVFKTKKSKLNWVFTNFFKFY